MIVSTVLVLTALVGNTIYVNYIPKTYSSQICFTNNISDIQPYCELMKIILINGTTMWYTKVDDKYLNSQSYFIVKYQYPNKTTINSEWKVLTQKDNLGITSNLYIIICFFVLICTMFLLISYFFWKIKSFLY